MATKPTLLTLSDDTLFLAATIMQAGRMGSTFKWALTEASANADQFAALLTDPPLTVSDDQDPEG